MKRQWVRLGQWQHTVVTIGAMVTLIGALWYGLTRAVDISRTPEAIKAVDLDAKARDAQIISMLGTNSMKMDLMLRRQNRVIEFIDSMTNHAPVTWPSYGSIKLLRNSP